MWWDSYPYSSLSVHALHPLYLRVTELDQEELNFPGSEEMTKYIEAKRRELQELKEVDYEETLRVKMLVAESCTRVSSLRCHKEVVHIQTGCI